MTRRLRSRRPFVFISYSHHDEQVVSEIVECLKSVTSGAVEFFVAGDARSMAAPETWVEQIEAALRKSWCVLAILSHAGASSEWVLFETGFAHALEIPVIPMGIQGFSVARHHPPLSLLSAVDAEDTASLNRLIAKLGKIVGTPLSRVFATADFERMFGAEPHLRIPQINTLPLVNKREIYRELVRLVQDCGLNDEIRATSMIFDPGDLTDMHFLEYLRTLAKKCAEAEMSTGNMTYHVIISVRQMPLSRRVRRALKHRIDIFHAVEATRRMRVFAMREHWSMNLLLVGREHAIIAFPADPKDGNVKFGLRVSGSDFVAPLVDWYDRCVEQRAQRIDLAPFISGPKKMRRE